MTSVRLTDLARVATDLKTDAVKADANTDGVLTTAEAVAYGHQKNDGFATGKALLTLKSWASHMEPEAQVAVSLAAVQGRVDAALQVIAARDEDGNGVLEGAEYDAAKSLKTFQAFETFLPEAAPSLDGLSFFELRERSEPLSETRYTDPASVPAELTNAILTAANESTYTSSTLAEVFAQVDQGEVVVRTFRDPETAQTLLSVDYGAGDSTYGAIFDAQTLTQVAAIHDGDLESR